jgi:signal transduction histidine kinase
VRRRILAASLAITLSAIALMTVVMAWTDWVSIAADNQRRLEVQADLTASRLHDRFDAAGGLTEADLADVLPPGSRLEVVTTGGETLVAGGPGVGGPSDEESVPGVGTMVLEDVSGTMEGNRLLAVGTIVGIGVALALVAVVVAFRTSRRLTTPIEELAAHAERLGTGDLRPTETTYGIAELDRLADSMDVSVQRIAALLAEERRLTLDASHQLKTPLTALSLRLEELAAWPDDEEVRAEARAALEQVERLSTVVDDLLRDRRAPYASRAQVPLGAVVDQQLSEWRPAFTAARRVLASQGSVPPPALVEPGPVGQVLAALIENSLVHGRGRTTVDVSTSNGAPWVEVSDEGPGVPDEIVARVFERDVSGAGGTGLGLAAAQDAAVSVGGRLALVRRRPAHFRFFLDGGKHPTPVGPEAEQGAEADADHVGGDVVSKG